MCANITDLHNTVLNCSELPGLATFAKALCVKTVCAYLADSCSVVWHYSGAHHLHQPFMLTMQIYVTLFHTAVGHVFCTKQMCIHCRSLQCLLHIAVGNVNALTVYACTADSPDSVLHCGGARHLQLYPGAHLHLQDQDLEALAQR